MSRRWGYQIYRILKFVAGFCRLNFVRMARNVILRDLGVTLLVIIGELSII